MFRTLMAASALALMTTAAPSFAQMPPMDSGTMTATDVGASPMMGVSATDYVKMAADSDMFEIKSAHVALMRSQRADVKSFAQMMIDDHTTSTKSIMAALNNQDRKITPPSMMLSSDKQAMLDLLKKTPKKNFDTVYLQQQMQAHQSAWALQKGYATDGTDASLKQVATTIVPVVEKHLTAIKGMMPPAAM